MPRGGRREGAGRKPWGGKFGEETKAVRVPASVVDKLPELIEAATSKSGNSCDDLKNKLQNLLDKWDAKTYCDDYSKNPRRKLAREFWSELKSLLE